MTDDRFLVDARKGRNKHKNTAPTTILTRAASILRGLHFVTHFDKVTASGPPAPHSGSRCPRREAQSLAGPSGNIYSLGTFCSLRNNKQGEAPPLRWCCKKKKKKKSLAMETLDASTLSASAAVTYDPKSEAVTLPGGVVSVAGITVVTGGVELSCGSCMLAFGFWGTLIGFSCVGVGTWDQINHFGGGTSHLLALGLVILALSFVVVGSVAAFHVLTKRRRERGRSMRRDGKEMLVEENVVKRVTV
ncbi:uncharacterized protein LOC144021929 [Festucalex cinctus]